jgi:hypothetical protein
VIRIRIWRIILVLGTVIIASVLLSGCLAGGAWDPKVGDFLEYSISDGVNQGTEKLSVISVTATSFTLNMTTTVPGLPPIYWEVTMLKNQTLGYDLNHPLSGDTVTKIGTETISTKWGERSVDHYRITYEEPLGNPHTYDLWARDGVLMKMVHVNMYRLLIDTNIPQIINP